jgi:putative phosphoesterase
MKIGIIADTHNHVENTRRALDILREYHVERVIHCGDISTPQIIELFEGWDAIFVFGNIDHSHADLMRSAKNLSGRGMSGYTYTADWDGVRVAICHGHDLGQLEEFIHSGLYDYVFHGHTHLRRDEQIEGTRVINPGALGGKQKQTRSLCVLDTDTGEAVFVELEDD